MKEPRPVLITSLALGLALAGPACGRDPLGPDAAPPPPDNSRLGPSGHPTAALSVGPTIITLLPSATLHSTSVSFYAKKGVSRSAAIYFRNASGGQGPEYVRLTVGPSALLAYPDSTPFATGDSVLITISIPVSSSVKFTMSPAGLQFSSSTPAKLKVSYAKANHDFDQDGDIDVFDFLYCELHLSVWHQVLGLPFLSVPSLLDVLNDRVTGDVTGFSQYAVAY